MLGNGNSRHAITRKFSQLYRQRVEQFNSAYEYACRFLAFSHFCCNWNVAGFKRMRWQQMSCTTRNKLKVASRVCYASLFSSQTSLTGCRMAGKCTASCCSNLSKQMHSHTQIHTHIHTHTHKYVCTRNPLLGAANENSEQPRV